MDCRGLTKKKRWHRGIPWREPEATVCTGRRCRHVDYSPNGKRGSLIASLAAPPLVGSGVTLFYGLVNNSASSGARHHSNRSQKKGVCTMSKLFEISYDLRKPGRDYASLIDAIKKMCGGNWAHPLESVWVVESQLTALQIVNHLRPYMDASDGMLVTKIGDDVAWFNLDPKVAAWLQQKASRAA